MKVLLIHPLHEKRGGEKKQIRQKEHGDRLVSFPLGIGYIAAVLKKAGHIVNTWDIHAENLLWTEVTEKIKNFDFDIIGISAISSQYLYAKRLSSLIKEKYSVPVIVGGALATYSAKLLLERCSVDYCVIGEGELTVVDLLNNLNNPQNVKGIAYKDQSGTPVFTEPRPYISDLGTLLTPAYDLFDMDFYVTNSTKMASKRLEGDTAFKRFQDLRTGYVITGRGCPYRCGFCSRNYRGVRVRPIGHIMEEIEFLKEKYKVQYIHFGDELLTLNKKRTLELCKEMQRIGLLWDCQSRVNLVDEEMLSAMKESGCVTLGFGIESGSQRLLDAMNKQITVEQIERAMRIAMKLDIDIKVQLMFGFPGENMESLQETIDLFKRLGHSGRRMTFFTVLPGTDIYDKCIAEGTIPDEDAYLCKLEEGGGWGKVLMNFTAFKDEKIQPRMKWARYTMMANACKDPVRQDKLFAKAERALQGMLSRTKKKRKSIIEATAPMDRSRRKTTIRDRIIKKVKGYLEI
jgi:anaerobic magnesium-protoporphyrin IX monomethyl ester cyclase